MSEFLVDAVRAAVDRFGNDRAFVRRFYDHDVVADSLARRQWVEPDRPLEILLAGGANAIANDQGPIPRQDPLTT